MLPAGAGRVIGAAGFTPPDVSRKERKARVQAARGAEAASRRALMAQRRAAIEAERRARKEASYLPASGEPGPQSLRAWRRLKIEPHRATSEVLSVAYPFLAEAGLGSDGPLIGHDSWSGAAFVYDPWALYERGVVTNPNGVLAGVIGRGKSTLAKSLATRSIAFGRRVYVPGDPKGEWTVVAKAVGGTAIELGTGNRLNPLDEGPRPAGIADGEWRTTVRQRRLALLVSLTEQSLGRPLLPVEHTALGAALDHSVRSAETSGEIATLPLVVETLLDPRAGHLGSTVEQLRDDGRQAGHGLGRLVFGDLAGLFDGPSTVGFDPTLPMVSLDLSRISGSDALIALVMTCASAWMEAALADPAGGQRWVIYDEAWRLMRAPTLLARMQSQWKLSRALGDREPDGHPPTLRPGRRGRRRLGRPEPRARPSRRLLDPDHLRAGARRGGEDRRRDRPVANRDRPAPRPRPRRRAVADRRTRVRRETRLHARRAGAVRHQRPNVRKR